VPSDWRNILTRRDGVGGREKARKKEYTGCRRREREKEKEIEKDRDVFEKEKRKRKREKEKGNATNKVREGGRQRWQEKKDRRQASP